MGKRAQSGVSGRQETLPGAFPWALARKAAKLCVPSAKCRRMKALLWVGAKDPQKRASVMEATEGFGGAMRWVSNAVATGSHCLIDAVVNDSRSTRRGTVISSTFILQTCAAILSQGNVFHADKIPSLSIGILSQSVKRGRTTNLSTRANSAKLPPSLTCHGSRCCCVE